MANVSNFKNLSTLNKLAAIASLCTIAGFFLSLLLPLGSSSFTSLKSLFSDEPKIGQKWDSNIAWGIVNSHLRANASLFDDLRITPLVHEKVGEYSLLYGDAESKVLVNFTQGHTDGVGYGKISIFEFKKTVEGWLLDATDIAAFDWGQWGQMWGSELDVRVLGPDRYGLFFKLSGLRQGQHFEFIYIFSKVADQYKEVFSIQSKLRYTRVVVDEDDFEPYESRTIDWKAFVEPLLGCPTGLCNISFRAKGSYKGNMFDDEIRFYFNGDSYKSDFIPQYLQ